MLNPAGVLPPQGARKSSVNLHVSTYNIHKGFSQFNRRMMIHELRDHLRLLDADIIFLQEVLGQHRRHAARFEDWPDEPQYEFLAHQVWNDYAYGRNAVYDHGHHGNAVLSRYPILRAENQDVSAHGLERRGLLHCEIGIPELDEPWRAPLLVAGDFNDWRNLAGKRLADALGLREALADHWGRPARSFPSAFPMLRLDRIYVRGFRVNHTEIHRGPSWSRLSDHAALSAHLQLE